MALASKAVARSSARRAFPLLAVDRRQNKDHRDAICSCDRLGCRASNQLALC
jgi:hypothetical protein